MAVTWAFDDGQLPAWGQAVSIIDCADMNGAPLAVTNAHRRAGLVGPRAVTPEVAANSGPLVDVSSTASYAAPTGRVPGLSDLGALSSSPVHRALVLVCVCVGRGDTNIPYRTGIVVLFEVV